jgi:hypothetical protein
VEESNLRNYLEICMEELRNTTENEEVLMTTATTCTIKLGIHIYVHRIGSKVFHFIVIYDVNILSNITRGLYLTTAESGA